MKWKEFLKPNFRRIIITAILTLSIFVSTFNFLLFNILVVTILFPIGYVDSLYYLQLIQYPQPKPGAGIVSPIGLTLKGWVITIMYFYLIAWLIDWAYDRVKKK